MDAQKTIDEVVEGVKSEGLFDQFRKECLEEFENMETYHQLKQRVENHVTSFLSKHKFHDGLQKNGLRSNLRNFISKSDVLLNGISQLVDEVLSLKGKSFCLRIDKQVDKHLSKKEPAPAVAPVATEQVPSGEQDNHEQSDLGPVQHSSPVQEDNSGNDNNIDIKVEGNVTDHVVVEEQKEILNNGTVTEFTEMEIEEVEMDLSENQEVHEPSEDEQVSEKHSNVDETVASVETEAVVNEMELDIKVKTEAVDEEVANTMAVDNAVNVTSVSNVSKLYHTNGVKNEPENVFIPISAVSENSKTDVAVKEEDKEEVDSDEDNKYDENRFDDNDEDDMPSSLNLPPIITEPITDDSNSNDSTFAENIKVKMDLFMSSQQQLPDKKDDIECRRKSSRVRTLPLKFREIDGIRKRADDADSVSSNDIDYKDLEDGTYLTGKRGRARKRPQSAGNPEIVANRIDRRSSVSRTSVDTTRRRKRSPSISKQEEEAINFLTKPEVRKTLSREGKASSKEDGERNSRMSRERGPNSRESREGNSSEKDDSDKYSRGCSRRKSESEKDDRKSERDRKSGTRDGSTSSKDDDTKSRRDRIANSSSGVGSSKDEGNRNARSKRDHKSDSGDGSYSGIEDDDKNSRSKRDKISESSSKDNDERKSRDRRDRKSSGSGKDEDRSSRNKKDNKSDSGGNHSEKDDSERKSRTKREESVETRDERDSHRSNYRKRFHSPAPSLEEVQSKRSRRSIKQRQRYTPP